MVDELVGSGAGADLGYNKQPEYDNWNKMQTNIKNFWKGIYNEIL